MSSQAEQLSDSAHNDSAPPTVPAESSVHSESCWGEMEDRSDDEAVEWGLLPHPAAPHAVLDVPQADDREVQVASLKKIAHPTIGVGGGGTRSQNCVSPEAQEEQISALVSPHRSQEGGAQAARAPLAAPLCDVPEQDQNGGMMSEISS